MVTMLVELDLTDDQFLELWKRASRTIPFKREDPQKAWTLKERKDVIRLYMQQLALRQDI